MLGAALFVGQLLAASLAAPTPAAIRRDVARDGATAAVRALSRQGLWDVIERRIGAGDAAWVALAPVLAPGVDAGTAEGLSISLADALPRNPRAVLAVITPDGAGPLTVDRVCSAPFIEDTRVHHAAYRRAALKALSTPAPGALEASRKACAGRLRSAA